MEKAILRGMGTDLGVRRYEDETEEQYCNRVLYSAMAGWIKASALDRPVTSEQSEYPGVSRRHIRDKCTVILGELLKRFPESKQWFETESEEEDGARVILSRLIRHGDLLKVGFETNLILAGSSRAPLWDGTVCIKGEVLLPGTYYSGLAMLQNIQKKEDGQRGAMTDAAAWFWDYLRSAWWKEAEFLENMQYFNAHKRGKNNESCWQWERPQPVEGVWLVRRSVYGNGHEYFLVRKEECLYRHQIDPFLQKIGEHRRFMTVMRYMAGNEVPVQVKHYADHIFLQLRIHLPQKESSLLETYGWPRKSVTDKLEWDMSEEVWEWIKPRFCSLGLKVTEEGEKHG